MKRIISLIFIAILALETLAQIPDQMSYQAIVRDSDDKLLAGQQIGIQISILSGSDVATATQVYSEVQMPTTSANGLISIEFGGDLGWEDIDWSAGNYFIKTEVDPIGGNNYSISGACKLLSVPYAFFAKTSGNTGSSVSAAIVFTNEVNMVTTTSAKTGGNIVGGSSMITERGVCWSTEQNPTVNDSNTTEGEGFGYFTSEISGLIPGETYYIRAYATSSTGTSYGNQVMFETTLNVLFPTVTTASVINITAEAAVSGGNVTSTGGDVIAARGVCWSMNQNPSIADSKTEDGTTTGEFQSQISGLSSGTYYVRAYATNSAGTGYGEMNTFETEKALPVVTTRDVKNISALGCVSGGLISSDGGHAITDKGICWSEFENPTTSDNKSSAGAGTRAFNSAIFTAVPGTNYYLRSYATNQLGTAYGEQKNFTSLDNVTFYDFETGMKPVGWFGNWSTLNEGFNSNYCLRSAYGQTNDISINVNMANQGQVRFYYKFSNCNGGNSQKQFASIQVFIDDDLNVKYNTSYAYQWQEGLLDIPSGSHRITWRFTPEKYYHSGDMGYGYIDYVIISD